MSLGVTVKRKDHVYEIQSTLFIADTVESVILGVYFSQTSEICFCPGFSYCPFYRGVRKAGVIMCPSFGPLFKQEN